MGNTSCRPRVIRNANPTPRIENSPTHSEFEGSAPLQSNTTHCPNQFSMSSSPHFPRGVIRLANPDPYSSRFKSPDHRHFVGACFFRGASGTY